jgi:hypothetical protein
VPAFHRGGEYYRIRQLMIRDVRLVYAPADSIGNFGGDIDNYEFPRQAGDFSFLRAYVGKDGRPADPSPDNVPYKSKDFLVVSAEGLKNGDPILLAGYPGRTSRYKLPSEIRFARDVDYPAKAANDHRRPVGDRSRTMGNPNYDVRYASVAKSLNNVLKKTQGLMDGFARKDIAAIKDVQDAEFRAWYKQHGKGGRPAVRPRHRNRADMAGSQQEAAWAEATHSDLLKSARTLYRLALERQKPDAQREAGYQERDLSFIKARLTASSSPSCQRRPGPLAGGLNRYAKIDAEEPSARPRCAAAEGGRVPALYKSTELADTNKRLAWIGKDPEAFRNSHDPFIQLAVRLQDTGDGAGRPPQGSRRQPGTRDPAIHGRRDRLEEVAGQAGLPGRQLDPARDLRHRGAVHAARRPGQGPVLDRRRHRRKGHQQGAVQRAGQAAAGDPREALRRVQGSGAGHGAGELPVERRHHRRQLGFGGDEQARRTGRPELRFDLRVDHQGLVLRPGDHARDPRRHPLHAVGDEGSRPCRQPAEGNDDQVSDDYLFTQGQYPFDLALHTNLEHNTDRTRGNNIEIGPVLQTEWYRWFFNAGVFADRDVDAAAPGRTRAKYQLLAKYRMQESFEAGVLVFGEAGDWDAAPGAQRGHRVGPVFMGALPVGNGHSFRYELSWLRGTIADRRTRNFNARLQYVF